MVLVSGSYLLGGPPAHRHHQPFTDSPLKLRPPGPRHLLSFWRQVRSGPPRRSSPTQGGRPLATLLAPSSQVRLSIYSTRRWRTRPLRTRALWEPPTLPGLLSVLSPSYVRALKAPPLPPPHPPHLRGGTPTTKCAGVGFPYSLEACVTVEKRGGERVRLRWGSAGHLHHKQALPLGRCHEGRRIARWWWCAAVQLAAGGSTTQATQEEADLPACRRGASGPCRTGATPMHVSTRAPSCARSARLLSGQGTVGT